MITEALYCQLSDDLCVFAPLANPTCNSPQTKMKAVEELTVSSISALLKKFDFNFHFDPDVPPEDLRKRKKALRIQFSKVAGNILNTDREMTFDEIFNELQKDPENMVTVAREVFSLELSDMKIPGTLRKKKRPQTSFERIFGSAKINSYLSLSLTLGRPIVLLTTSRCLYVAQDLYKRAQIKGIPFYLILSLTVEEDMKRFKKDPLVDLSKVIYPRLTTCLTLNPSLTEGCTLILYQTENDSATVEIPWDIQAVYLFNPTYVLMTSELNYASCGSAALCQYFKQAINGKNLVEDRKAYKLTIKEGGVDVSTLETFFYSTRRVFDSQESCGMVRPNKTICKPREYAIGFCAIASGFDRNLKLNVATPEEKGIIRKIRELNNKQLPQRPACTSDWVKFACQMLVNTPGVLIEALPFVTRDSAPIAEHDFNVICRLQLSNAIAQLAQIQINSSLEKVTNAGWVKLVKRYSGASKNKDYVQLLESLECDYDIDLLLLRAKRRSGMCNEKIPIKKTCVRGLIDSLQLAQIEPLLHVEKPVRIFVGSKTPHLKQVITMLVAWFNFSPWIMQVPHTFSSYHRTWMHDTNVIMVDCLPKTLFDAAAMMKACHQLVFLSTTGFIEDAKSNAPTPERGSDEGKHLENDEVFESEDFDPKKVDESHKNIHIMQLQKLSVPVALYFLLHKFGNENTLFHEWNREPLEAL
jgi:hypothetical protein